jgi:uncharacterized protein (TIGR02996 family)
MSEEDALLSAIAADPDEDTPRLVYADWLDEHDRHARAEFIRLQIDMARKEALLDFRQLADVEARNAELYKVHRREFLGPLVALPDGAVTGFAAGSCKLSTSPSTIS